MNIEGWEYYNHAMIPTTAPHEIPDLAPVYNGKFWKIKEYRPLLARWTTRFDCGVETNWWNIIKDNPFDISELKAKRRYEINKGNKKFQVQVINPTQYTEEICEVYKEALTGYPPKYRPTFNEADFIESVCNEWKDKCIYGGFDRETGKLCGYALLTIHDSYVAFNVLKTIPEYEKYAINAAIVYGILSDFNYRLGKAFYICDGERNISHETDFQNYLEKYFGFRKAYCVLNISYRPVVHLAVKLLYPFRKWLKVLNSNSFIHNVIAVLYMEELKRESEKERN